MKCKTKEEKREVSREEEIRGEEDEEEEEGLTPDGEADWSLEGSGRVGDDLAGVVSLI